MKMIILMEVWTWYLLLKQYLKKKIKEKKNNHPIKQIPMRPDHGHTILHDQFNSVIPGYSLLGRMKGLDQLKGVIKAIN